MPDPTTIDELLERARAGIERLDPPAAYRAQHAGAILVDTRCAELRHESGVVPGSVHVPLSVLFWRLDQTSGYGDPRFADRDREIVLLCAHGYSSSLAAATLRELGFTRVTDVIGGFESWAAAGLPVESGTEAAGSAGQVVGAAGQVVGAAGQAAEAATAQPAGATDAAASTTASAAEPVPLAPEVVPGA